MQTVDLIRERLNNLFNPAQLDIVDESHQHAGHAGAAGGGGHFAVTIVSEKFRDHSTLERHRMVYQAVDDLMPAEIHALSIKALAPEEYNE